jgi:DNA polymerase V
LQWSASHEVCAVFALVDGNAFYCSCEQVFSPELRGKPLVVLSNNDGCAIARTDEAKALGIRMGHPVFELRELERRRGLKMRSANFALYGDMSARMVTILREAAPRVEVYSIDESFLDLAGVSDRDRERLTVDLRAKLLRWIGIPTCIGIGPTKTLAKLANKAAKKGLGIVDVTDPSDRRAVLDRFPVADVWGVGRRWAAKLGELGVSTAAHLRDAPADLILQRFGIVLSRTQRELQGLSCSNLQEVEPDRQQIMVSRSFGSRVKDHAEIAEAIATFTERAAAKMRKRGLVCAAIAIHAESDVFRPELPQHHPSRSMNLPAATGDTSLLLAASRRMLCGLLREGIEYRRAGVVLLDLARPESLQHDLFSSGTIGNASLMTAMDAINARFGRQAVGFGATGWRSAPAWAMRQALRSPRYTTRADELPSLQC